MNKVAFNVLNIIKKLLFLAIMLNARVYVSSFLINEFRRFLIWFAKFHLEIFFTSTNKTVLSVCKTNRCTCFFFSQITETAQTYKITMP